MIAIFTTFVGTLVIPPIVLYYSSVGLKRTAKNPFIIIVLVILMYFLWITAHYHSRVWYGNPTMHSLIILVVFIFSFFFTETCIQNLRSKLKNRIFLALFSYIVFSGINSLFFFMSMNGYSEMVRRSLMKY